jgi:hypothetical protein
MPFQAFYEDAAKLKSAAMANGWTDGDGSMLDYADADQINVHTGRNFSDKDAAVAWVQAEVNALRTVFGAGDVVEFENLARGERCEFCTCRGKKRVHRYVVTDIGIESDEAIDECL